MAKDPTHASTQNFTMLISYIFTNCHPAIGSTGGSRVLNIVTYLAMTKPSKCIGMGSRSIQELGGGGALHNSEQNISKNKSKVTSLLVRGWGGGLSTPLPLAYAHEYMCMYIYIIV